MVRPARSPRASRNIFAVSYRVFVSASPYVTVQEKLAVVVGVVEGEGE